MRPSQQRLMRRVARSGVDEKIVQAFERVDRARYVPEDLQDLAYVDRPVALPASQTTSQPSLIAHMIDAASVGPADVVLEVGTGFGFQTALLAHLASEVVSLERHPELAEGARRNLDADGLSNVDVRVADGWKGWPERAPYDAVIVSAAAPSFPEALGEQLAEGGRLVVPLKVPSSDEVTLFVKEEGEVRRVRVVSPARFVPLVKEG